MANLENDSPVLISKSFPVSYAPASCLDCPEILCEDYGCIGRQKCVGCVAANGGCKTEFPVG